MADSAVSYIEDDSDSPYPAYYSNDGEDDLIEEMLYLDESSCSDSPTPCGFNQYSGYLLTTNDHEIHYWFYEADTEDDPMNTRTSMAPWTVGTVTV